MYTSDQLPYIPRCIHQHRQEGEGQYHTLTNVLGFCDKTEQELPTYKA
jgi:hypothetical protein